eukprot:504474-Rhodomonas_salina.1
MLSPMPPTTLSSMLPPRLSPGLSPMPLLMSDAGLPLSPTRSPQPNRRLTCFASRTDARGAVQAAAAIMAVPCKLTSVCPTRCPVLT